MGFKEDLEMDVDDVFMDLEEFADKHTIDGKEMSVIVDEIELIHREQKLQSNIDGIYKKKMLMYVRASEFGALPAIERLITFDSKKYIVKDAKNESGIYSITLEVSRA